ncbi:hypothetical protein [Methylobacterium oxalidis]|uniref:hypothetical protein n=1 Tax=Methylobacterium oxalidis TaxID=944322 RepID=UPI00331555EE
MKALLRHLERRIERVEKAMGIHEQFFTVEGRSEEEFDEKIAEIKATQYVGKRAIFVCTKKFVDEDGSWIEWD